MKDGSSSGKKRVRARLSQSDVPKFSLEDAITVPKALCDKFDSEPTDPLLVAQALDISPTSSNWRELSGSAIAYGLTAGAYNAEKISVANLGKHIVTPQEEGQDIDAKIEAVLAPKILGQFFRKYNKNKFPRDEIAVNVLVEMGVPPHRGHEILDIVKKNGRFVGILLSIKGSEYVQLEAPRRSVQNLPTKEQPTEAGIANQVPVSDEKPGLVATVELTGATAVKGRNARVFIAHGKNLEIANQLKELLKFGKLEPVVAEEQETTSIPVPDKVLERMRSCNAGILHLEKEQDLVDSSGNAHRKINENVLIEIGAAMALYGNNFILLVQKGIRLPSNLQGLYRCEYEGDRLDYESTMKLLRAFNDFS